MKVLITPDNFKGSLSAKEVCEAIASGLRKKEEPLDITFHPMADGGDGSIEILADHLSLEEVSIKSQDPLGRPITAKYFTSKDAAFIEVASASGLVLLEESERNPMHTSTLGTGILLHDAISKGHQNIYLFLGGSATNDAGMGIVQALGYHFLDKENNILTPVGKNLSNVKSIKNNNLFDFSEINISVFCDVLNPLFGKNGAAHIYGPQKGATAEEVQYLNSGLINFSNVLQKRTGIDVSAIVGGGAAGGIGVGLVALCGAQLKKGFKMMAELTNLEAQIQQADWVISGEGRLDGQSLQGKVIDGIANLCQKHQKRLSLFVGKNNLSEKELLALNINQALSISSIAKNHEDAMRNGRFYLEVLAKDFLLI